MKWSFNIWALQNFQKWIEMQSTFSNKLCNFKTYRLGKIAIENWQQQNIEWTNNVIVFTLTVKSCFQNLNI